MYVYVYHVSNCSLGTGAVVGYGTCVTCTCAGLPGVSGRMAACPFQGNRDIPCDICPDLGPGRVEDMSRHLPGNLVTKRDVMSCRDIWQDTSANASAPRRGTDFGKISGVETEEISCDSCRFDVVLCDFSGIFEILPNF